MAIPFQEADRATVVLRRHEREGKRVKLEASDGGVRRNPLRRHPKGDSRVKLATRTASSVRSPPIVDRLNLRHGSCNPGETERGAPMSSKPFAPYTGALDGARIADPDTLPAGAPMRRFDEAIELMESGRWAASFACLAELADAGHPQAARIALIFVKRGTSLFGGVFHASPEQRACWQRAGD
jgi:hypothetical protein